MAYVVHWCASTLANWAVDSFAAYVVHWCASRLANWAVDSLVAHAVHSDASILFQVRMDRMQLLHQATSMVDGQMESTKRHIITIIAHVFAPCLGSKAYVPSYLLRWMSQVTCSDSGEVGE